MVRNTLITLTACVSMQLGMATCAAADDVIILEDLPADDAQILDLTDLTEPSESEAMAIPAVENSEQDEDASTSDDVTTPMVEPAVAPTAEPTAEAVAPMVEPDAEAATSESAAQGDENVKINVVNVNESFFKITSDTDTGSEVRTSTQEAKPGDLIEIVISATNASDETLRDVELTNSVPTGPINFLKASIETDLNNGLYRTSRNGTDFFPAEADVSAEAIRFIQWVIFTLPAGETATFRYRIQINPA